MPRRRESVAPLTVDGVVASHLAAHDRAISKLRQSKMGAVQVIDIENFNDPAEGMTCINWPTAQFCYYHNDEWICLPSNACHAIKVYSDRKATAVANGAFRFAVEPDLDDTDIMMMKAFVGTVGTSATQVTVTNDTRGTSFLTSPLVIPSGQFVSNTATVATTISEAIVAGRKRNNVHEDEMIWINVTIAGAGSKGLGIYIYFATPKEDNTV